MSEFALKKPRWLPLAAGAGARVLLLLLLGALSRRRAAAAAGSGPECWNPEVVVAITGRVLHNAMGCFD